jgi:hypothetical protein
MLHQLRVLVISYGVVVNFSGLRSLKKLTMCPVDYLEPCHFIGTETFSQLETLEVGEIGPESHCIFQTSFQQVYFLAPNFQFEELAKFNYLE